MILCFCVLFAWGRSEKKRKLFTRLSCSMWFFLFFCFCSSSLAWQKTTIIYEMNWHVLSRSHLSTSLFIPKTAMLCIFIFLHFKGDQNRNKKLNFNCKWHCWLNFLPNINSCLLFCSFYKSLVQWSLFKCLWTV